MISGIIYQLISMFSFGTGNVIWKLPQKSFGVFKIIALRSIVSVILIGSLMLYNNHYIGSIDDWLFAFLISAVSFLGLAFYNLSIKYTTVSQSVTTTSVNALFGVITSIMVYHEKLTWNLIASLLLIIIGLFFLENKKPLMKWSRGTIYALLAAFFWGTTFALFRIPAESLGSINFSFVLEITVLSCAIIMLSFQKKEKYEFAPTIKTYFTIALIGTLGFLGVIFYNMAVTLVPVSILSVMGSFTTVISIVIAHIILKERFKSFQYLGMALTITAVLVLLI